MTNQSRRRRDAQDAVSIRPMERADWEAVARIDKALFDGHGEIFDMPFFRRVDRHARDLVSVAWVDGRIDGYLSLAPLSGSGLSAVQQKCVTTIASLSLADFAFGADIPAAYFFEVIAVVPGARPGVAFRLVALAMRTVRRHSTFDWYGTPITDEGLALAEKAGFRRFRGPCGNDVFKLSPCGRN